jgi:SAM-dependent methyltransferase
MDRVNENHRRVCTSPEWAQYLQDDVLPSLAERADFGAEMLEIGPGPGAATDWLRHRVKRLVAIDPDPGAVARLSERFSGTNVEVQVGDGTSLAFDDGSFDSVGTFTMLHHVPTLGQQAATLAEALRVLVPGGVLVGSDSLASTGLHEFHEDDTYNPIDPSLLLAVLRSAGYEQITVVVGDELKFVAHKPNPTGGPS